MPYTDEEFELIKEELKMNRIKLKFRMKLLFFFILILIILIVFIVLFFFDDMIQKLILISGVTAGSLLMGYFQLTKWIMEYANTTKDFHKNFFDKTKEE